MDELIKKLLPDTKTLLYGFISNRVNSWDEPTRKDTPRGMKIGLSTKKYLFAHLTACVNRMQKDISQDIELSIGLGRVWNSEQDVKDTQENTLNNFTIELTRYIEGIVKEVSAKSDAWLKKNALKASFDKDCREFADSISKAKNKEERNNLLQYKDPFFRIHTELTDYRTELFSNTDISVKLKDTDKYSDDIIEKLKIYLSKDVENASTWFDLLDILTINKLPELKHALRQNSARHRYIEYLIKTQGFTDYNKLKGIDRLYFPISIRRMM